MFEVTLLECSIVKMHIFLMSIFNGFLQKPLLLFACVFTARGNQTSLLANIQRMLMLHQTISAL